MRRSSLPLICVGMLVTAACGDDTSGSGGSGSGGAPTTATGASSGSPTTSGLGASSGTTTSSSGSPDTSSSAGGGAVSSTSTSTGGSQGFLAEEYPGDVGIENDASVVWAESFEEGSIGDLAARYEQVRTDGMTLEGDVSEASSGAASGRFTASGAGPNAVDLYKNLGPGYDELFIRYYVKYQADVMWHHTGVWVGGYAPASNYPNPQAGLRPNGDDRFVVSVEPVFAGSPPRMDTYNYWMNMHSWMDVPEGDTAYYGNALIHDESLLAKESWQCVEIHIKVNDDLASAAGGQLGVWVDDVSMLEASESGPDGYWVKDKWCPDDTTAAECTDYRPEDPVLEPVNLQVRTTADLKINAFWPQNYITDGGAGSVWYDDMVLATRRIGCIRSQ